MENMEDMKRSVSNRTGVPVELLNGESEEEMMAQAGAVLAFISDKLPVTDHERNGRIFEAWVNAAHIPSGLVPEGVHDAGEVSRSDRQPDNREKFAEWFSGVIR